MALDLNEGVTLGVKLFAIVQNAVIRADRVSVLILLLVVSLAAPSCAPAPPPVQAAKALSVTATSVDMTMKVAGDLYRQGIINDPQKHRILAAYSTYQNAARTAYAAVRVWNQSAEGKPIDLDEVQRAANALIALVAEFQKKGP